MQTMLEEKNKHDKKMNLYFEKTNLPSKESYQLSNSE